MPVPVGVGVVFARPLTGRISKNHDKGCHGVMWRQLNVICKIRKRGLAPAERVVEKP